MTSISFGCAYIGSMFLSMSLKRHYQQVWPKSTGYLRWLTPNRITGYSFIALSFLPCLISNSLGIATVLWLSVLAAAAFLHAILLTYLPERAPFAGGFSVVLIVAGALL